MAESLTADQRAPVPAGVTAVYVYDGRVIAHASDFSPDRPGGCTVLEGQTYRAKQRLAFAVVKALSSPTLYENMDAYDCERIMGKIGGKCYVLPVGHPNE